MALDPLLKWAGGKRWQAEFLGWLWRQHGSPTLVEPFAGGMAITLALLPDNAVVNDINPYLINFYRWVADGLDPTELEMRNDRALFDSHRERFNALIQDDEGAGSADAARLFYYLNRTTYNGLCRFNKSGEFNAPFGKYKTVNYRTDFAEHAQVFSERCDFSAIDFERLVLDPTDFVYADPVYDGTFDDYAAGGFAWADQERTARWLAKHDGPVVLCNAATPRIKALYRDLGYHVVFVHGPRSISRKADGRTPAVEIFATRNIDPALIRKAS